MVFNDSLKAVLAVVFVWQLKQIHNSKPKEF